MPSVNIPPLKNDDDATPEAFNSRFGKIADVINGGLDSANLSDGSVTTTKLADASVTAAKIASEPVWQAVTYQNNWTKYDDTWGGGEYYKDLAGIVHMRGLIKTGAVGSVAFTLPAGYRPTVAMLFVVESSDAIGRVDVRTNGEVVVVQGSSNWVSLANVKFRAEQ